MQNHRNQRQEQHGHAADQDGYPKGQIALQERRADFLGCKTECLSDQENHQG